jgi:uncharacterized membrane protein
MLYAALLGLHLIAAAFWVGGMAAMHLAVRPAAVDTLEPPQRLPFMASALDRFFGGVTLAIVGLLVSGLAMIWLAGGFGAARWHVHTMFGIGLLMMAIFGHVRFGPYRRLQRAVAARAWAQAAPELNLIRRLVALNLALGTAVFVLASAGRVL